MSRTSLQFGDNARRILTEVALFPLSQVVLPRGRMKLRVFEPRYIRLVREACAGKRPFASALLNPYVAQTHPDRIFGVATLVQVTDFTQLDDGLLGITIEGLQRIEVNHRWQESDGLHVASYSLLPDWEESVFLPEHQQLSSELSTVFSQNPQLQELYPQPQWQNPCWLAQRWIEVLTMQPPLKNQLMAADSATPALEALCSWLQTTQNA
jgi:uncharacterized protein